MGASILTCSSEPARRSRPHRSRIRRWSAATCGLMQPVTRLRPFGPPSRYGWSHSPALLGSPCRLALRHHPTMNPAAHRGGASSVDGVGLLQVGAKCGIPASDHHEPPSKQFGDPGPRELVTPLGHPHHTHRRTNTARGSRSPFNCAVPAYTIISHIGEFSACRSPFCEILSSSAAALAPLGRRGPAGLAPWSRRASTGEGG